MNRQKYDNEKVIFGSKEVSLDWTNPNRGFMKWFIKEFNQLAKKQPKLKVLDVGGGAGAKAKILKSLFPRFKFSASDISRKAIKIAKKNPQGVEFFVADAAKLPIKDNQFDVVMMNSVLDHTLQPQQAVKEVYRVLKPGGIWLVTGPLEAELTTIHGWLTKFDQFRQMRKERCGHNFAFSRKTFLTMIKEAGFKIKAVSLDWFLLTQLMDVIYYPVLKLMGRPPEFNFEAVSGAMQPLRKLAILMQNVESELWFKRFPWGFFIYVRAVKK